jgi:hypothetical protein
MRKVKDLFFKHKKYKVTSEQLGEALWRLSGGLTNDWIKTFYKGGIPEYEDFPTLTDKDRQTLLWREVFIINNWIISNVLSSNRKVLDYLNKFYLEFYFNLGKTDEEKQEVFEFIKNTMAERYEQYFKYSDSASKLPLLGSFMLQNMLGKEEPILDASLQFSVVAYITSTMEAVANFLKNYEIIEEGSIH